MWTVIGDFDRTNNIDPPQYELHLGIQDDLPSLKFDLDDNGSQINLQPGMEMIVYDETQQDIVNNIPMVPARNILVNPSIAFLTNWTANGNASSTIVWSQPSSGPNLGRFIATQTFSNTAVGSGYYSQNTLINYVQPGQSYCFSYWVEITGTLTNCNAFAKLQFLDGGLNVIGSATTDTFTTTTGNTWQRRSITATAPAGAVYAQVQWGGNTTNATNSGVIVWGGTTQHTVAFQLEPMWFVDQGVSYPTPDLGYYIVGSGADLPDGTDSRRCRLFAGYIDDVQVEYIGGTNRLYHVSCAGPGWVLENVNLLDADYTSSTYDNTIINNFLSNNYQNILSGSALFNTASGTIIQGALVDATTYTDQTLREILNTLADISGYIYWVDPYYHLHYTPNYWDVAPVTFNTIANAQDYVTVFPPRDYKLEQDLTQIKNRIKVTGSQQDQTVQDLFSGNGSNKVFTLTRTPHIITNCTVGGAVQQVGVQGVATNGQNGVTAIYDPSSKQLTFNTAPASGTNNVVVTYSSPQPVSVVVQSLDSYAKYGNRYWDSKVNDSSLASVQTAHQRGLAELNKYQYALVTLTFKTDQFVLAGQIILFTSSTDGYTTPTPFLARKVTGRYLGNGENEYELESGPYVPDMLDLFRHLHKAVNRSQGVANQLAPGQNYIVANDTTMAYTEQIRTTTRASTGAYVYGTATYGFSSYS
jgi:hypothetical protein